MAKIFLTTVLNPSEFSYESLGAFNNADNARKVIDSYSSQEIRAFDESMSDEAIENNAAVDFDLDEFEYRIWGVEAPTDMENKVYQLVKHEVKDFDESVETIAVGNSPSALAVIIGDMEAYELKISDPTEREELQVDIDSCIADSDTYLTNGDEIAYVIVEHEVKF